MRFFIIFVDNFSVGTFYISEYEVEILTSQLEDGAIEDFEVAGNKFKKSKVGGVRIGGNISFQFN